MNVYSLGQHIAKLEKQANPLALGRAALQVGSKALPLLGRGASALGRQAARLGRGVGNAAADLPKQLTTPWRHPVRPPVHLVHGKTPGGFLARQGLLIGGIAGADSLSNHILYKDNPLSRLLGIPDRQPIYEQSRRLDEQLLDLYAKRYADPAQRPGLFSVNAPWNIRTLFRQYGPNLGKQYDIAGTPHYDPDTYEHTTLGPEPRMHWYDMEFSQTPWWLPNETDYWNQLKRNYMSGR